jgi:hypothetical protein
LKAGSAPTQRQSNRQFHQAISPVSQSIASPSQAITGHYQGSWPVSLAFNRPSSSPSSLRKGYHQTFIRPISSQPRDYPKTVSQTESHTFPQTASPVIWEFSTKAKLPSRLPATDHPVISPSPASDEANSQAIPRQPRANPKKFFIIFSKMTKTFSFPVFYRQFYRRTSIFPSDPRRKKTPE